MTETPAQLQIDFAALTTAVQRVRAELLTGLIAIDIADRQTGLSLASYNSQPTATALFAKVTRDLSRTLSDAGFAAIRRYYLVELEENRVVVVLRHGESLQTTMLLDSEKARLGWALGMVVPQLIDDVAEAVS